MPLGKFLEVSIASADVAASLAFYESLGFAQADVGEALPYPYAVVTDGRVCIGLHQREAPAGATLTWVLPNLAGQIESLEALGVAFDYTRIDDTALNSAGFVDPSGQAVTILEARTFSPPSLPPACSSSLGYFEEFAIPTRDLPAAAAFWERLGFIAFDPVTEPFGKIVAMGRDLNIGLYDLDLPGPALVFSDPDMAQTVARLLERGHAFASLPRALIAADCALLQAPEGTLLLLRATPADTWPLDTGGFELQETPRD